MTAAQIARALGGRRSGATWMARCPVHADRTASLAIRAGEGGRVLVRCHAGCDQASVVEALRARGLWAAAGRPRPVAPPVVEPDPEAARRGTVALELWEGARPAEDTPVAAYLRVRGIARPIPTALRFHPGLRHPAGSVWPAMVALVTDGVTGEPIAVHRTFLARDGSGKAPVEPAKMMLGPCRGGAVRLRDGGEGTFGGDGLMVGEGIETCLAMMEVNARATWAALSTSGLRTLELPEAIRDVTVLADGDEPGEQAARACALRWRREGRRVRIASAPPGMDFNDVLMSKRGAA